MSSPAVPAAPPRIDGAVLRRGVRVLGVAVREQPRIFALAVTASTVYAAVTVAQAWVLGRVVDRVVAPAFAQGRTTSGVLVAGFAALVAVAVLKATSIAVRRLSAGVMQFRLQAAYRRRVTRQYLRLPLAWHQRHPAGQLLSNANADVEATWYVIAPLPMAVGVVMMLVIAGGAMLVTDAVLALVAFLVFPSIFAVNLVYQRRLSPLATRAQHLRAQVSEVAHESFDGAMVVKTLGREAAETERFAAVSNTLRDTQVRVGRVRGVFDPAMEALPSLGVLAVLLLGSWLIERGRLAPGELVQVAYLFTLLAFPVRAIGWVLAELPRSVVGWARVRSVLDAGGATAYGERDLPGRGPADLRLRGVSFSYPAPADDDAGKIPTTAAEPVEEPAEGPGAHLPGAQPSAGRRVLHDITLDVAPGRTVAVVGPTGSGKSTLTTLLVRLVDPDSGRVLLDGVDLAQVRRGGVAGAAAVVPQQTFLFDDSVRDNVTLGLPVDDAQVWAALRLAQAEGFVAALPEGLSTTVGERGATLSGGQRQRLALARALVRRPRLLVLDDATSSVDPRVEAAVLAGLRDRQDDQALAATVVVVAYRPATIALADEVVYVEQGRVVDRGHHLELLRRSPGYRRLVTAYERETQIAAGAAGLPASDGVPAAAGAA